MGQSFSRELKQFNLSLTEWRVCVALHHQAHQRLSELALHTSTEPSTLSRVVDGLLQRGVLVRDRSDEDARALALSLTEAGRDLTLRIIPLAQLYERVSLSGLTLRKPSPCATCSGWSTTTWRCWTASELAQRRSASGRRKRRTETAR